LGGFFFFVGSSMITTPVSTEIGYTTFWRLLLSSGLALATKLLMSKHIVPQITAEIRHMPLGSMYRLAFGVAGTGTPRTARSGYLLLALVGHTSDN